MEEQHDTLSNHEIRQLWTRFEGLVGHQLHRLQEDNGPENKSALSPGKAVSSGAVLVACSSSTCSVMASDISSLTTATSPARLPEKFCQRVRESSVDEPLSPAACHEYIEEADGGVVEEGNPNGDFKREDVGSPVDRDIKRENIFVGSPVDVVDIDGHSGNLSCADGDGSKVDDEEPGRGGGDGIDADAGLSCCVVPSAVSCTSQESVQSSVMKRNSSTNAVNSCESQPLFGLPYVARAAGPLLSLLNVTLNDWEGKVSPRADTLLKLKGKRRECKRNMIGVYKQSLLLESQLHQYLNPGLVISLNRRVARATFDAEMMAKLIDKLRKESKRSVEDPERIMKVTEVTSRIKTLLGRQKCEWQCVGRLKETLTMAKEMKDLLRFIARLSNTLEKSKSAFGGLQDRPPPYDYCSPYADIPKTIDAAGFQLKTDAQNSRSHATDDSKCSLIETNDSQDQVQEIKINRGICSDSTNRVADLSVVSECGQVSSSVDNRGYPRRVRGRRVRSIKDRVTPRGRSLTPRRLSRSPLPKRSSSTNFEMDSYSSFRDSNFLSKSSAREEFSENSNVSNPLVFDLSNTNTKGKKYATNEWTNYQVSQEAYDCMNSQKNACYDDEPPRNKRMAENFEQECEGGGISNEGCSIVCKTMKNGSPPRACPRADCSRRSREEKSGGRCSEKNNLYCDKTCVIETRKKVSPRWDRSPTPRGKLSDIEGPRGKTTVSSDYHFSSELDSEQDISARSSPKKSMQEKRRSKTKSLQEKGGKGSPHSKRASSAPSSELKVGSGSERSGGDESCSEEESPCSMDDQSLASCDYSEGIEGSGRSGSICIDIESEYPKKNVPPSASCPPGFRRIRVKVNKRSSSTSNDRKRNTKESEGSKYSEKGDFDDESEEDMKRFAASENLSDHNVVDKFESPVQKKADEGVVLEQKISHTSPAEVLLSAHPSPTRSPTKSPSRSPTPQRKKSSLSPRESSHTGGNADQSSQLSLPLVSEYELPILGKLDEPWKLLLAGLLLLLLLYLLWWLLSGRCCGCGYFPNPLFFLTNSLASRMTLRHNGLAPI